jgi:prephenate dehydratase
MTTISRATRVAFQGELGAFSEEGAQQLWGPGVEAVSYRAFDDATRAVERADVDLALLPIENTLAGSVVGSYDALVEAPTLHVVAQTVVSIHHCVLAKPGVALDALHTVHSHPVALAQCGRWLRAHPAITPRAAYDTAGAARDVAESDDPTMAAIAGRAAAARYGLEIVAVDIEDRPDNQTRFLAVARQPAALPDGRAVRTALSLTTQNVPGALLRVLQPLAKYELNMTKLESRPTGEPWTYRFFVEFDHVSGGHRAVAAIHAMRSVTEELRVLGTFEVGG